MKFEATVVYETATTIVIEADSLKEAQAQYDRILHLNLSEFHAMGEGLDEWYVCPECGHEGFLEDMQHGAAGTACERYESELKSLGHGFEVYAIEHGRNGLESLEDVKPMEDAR